MLTSATTFLSKARSNPGAFYTKYTKFFAVFIILLKTTPLSKSGFRFMYLMKNTDQFF